MISFAYNEPINIGNLNNGQITMRRLRDNTPVPITVSGYNNQIIITPVNSIATPVGDRFRVVVQKMTDRYGNVKATPDISRFVVGSSIASTGPRVLNVSIMNPVLNNIDPGTIDIYFTMPTTNSFDKRVYYTITGTGLLHNDYDMVLPGTNRNIDSFNGAQGVIVIPKGAYSAVLKIDPVYRNSPGANKTIKINLAEGGDYTLGTNTAVTGTITYNAILPLQLVSFSGKPAGETVNLQWQTVNEVNTASFTVEKSADGITFASSATVSAKGAATTVIVLLTLIRLPVKVSTACKWWTRMVRQPTAIL